MTNTKNGSLWRGYIHAQAAVLIGIMI